MTAYDRVPYRSLPIPEAHVDRLFMMGELFGTQPAPPAQARVLEIGCADGGHLVPQALAYPRSTFVGIDLAAAQIDAGRAFVEPLAPDNLSLIAGDATSHPAAEGPFDYVICHGVFSWVPPDVQAPLLQTVARALGPRGIALMSYNVLPGFHLRQTIRTFLLEQMAPETDPPGRVEAARALIGFLREATPTDTPRGRALAQACTQLLAASPQFLLHGLLGAHNHPFTLGAFVAAAQEAGLAYLGDAELGTMTGVGLPPASQERLAEVPGDQIQREQVLDVLLHRAFRSTLLVPRARPIDRRVSWRKAWGWWASLRTVPEGLTDGPWRQALTQLANAWPGQLQVSDWIRDTSRLLGRSPASVAPQIGPRLLPAWADGTLSLHPRDLGIASQVPARPVATAWARRQQALGHPVTDLRHQHRRLPDHLGRALQACTGAGTGPAREEVEALMSRSLLQSV